MRSHVQPITIAVLSLAVSTAHAQQGASAARLRELLSQAEQARVAGDHARAIERALVVARLRETASIHYFLAREYSDLDRSVDALGHATACLRGVEGEEPGRFRDALTRACRAIVASHEPRVSRVRLLFGGPIPRGVVVRVGGATIDHAELGVTLPVAPGEVTIETSGRGYQRWQYVLNAVAGRNYDVPIRVTTTRR